MDQLPTLPIPDSYNKYFKACSDIADRIIENFRPDNLSHPAELTIFFAYFKSIFNSDPRYFEEDSRGRALFCAIDTEDMGQSSFMSKNIVKDLFRLPKDLRGLYVFQVLFPKGFVAANKALGNPVSADNPVFLADKFSMALKMSGFFYADLIKEYNPDNILDAAVYLDFANRVKWLAQGMEEHEDMPIEASPTKVMCAKDLLKALDKFDNVEISRISSEVVFSMHHYDDPEKGKLVVFSFLWPKLFITLMSAVK